MTGSVELWPVMADCERGLGRPERAMAMAGAPEVQKLDKAGQVEMRLVAAGARQGHGSDRGRHRDPSEPGAGVQLRTALDRAAALRLCRRSAGGGREGEAREWFAKALEADKDGAPTRRTGWPSWTVSSSWTPSTRMPWKPSRKTSPMRRLR